MTSRRDAVRALAGITALPLLGKPGFFDLVEAGERAHARAEQDAWAPRALTDAELAIVTEAAERIIPRTDTPGATDAKVASFIDVMLADWYEPAERERFTNGLRELESRSNSAYSRRFTKLASGEQTKLLETLDQELQTARATPAGANDSWFAMLKFLTIWGYYTSRVGITDELKVQVIPGHYDGNAPY